MERGAVGKILVRPLATTDLRVFVSDVHIPVKRVPCERQDRFLDFLASMSPAPKELYLLGDILEFWYEYPSVMYSAYFPLLHRLKTLSEAGTTLHLITGNHDFWAGPLLSELADIRIHHDCFESEMSGRKAFMCHGDGYAPEDRAYRLFRRFLRSRLCHGMMRLLPPAVSARWADRVARMTRVHSSRNDNKDHRALDALASKMVGEGLDIFLCAHLHAPEIKEVSGGGRKGLFINVGDWWERDSYALERDGIFSLCRDREDERVWG